MATSNEVPQKPIHSLILDTGPLIKNVVSISTIINSAEELYTTPAILSEIRDEATRSRVQTTLMPFLKVRTPSPASYDAVIAFSKKTGDHAVLSRQDLGILALAYEIHCEKNGGDWGLRETPGQPVKRRPGETSERAQNFKDSTQKSNTRTKSVKPTTSEIEAEPVAEDGWEVPKGKRAIKSKFIKPPKFTDEPELVQEEPQLDAAAEQTESHQEIDEEDGGVALQEPQSTPQSNFADTTVDTKEQSTLEENTSEEEQHASHPNPTSKAAFEETPSQTEPLQTRTTTEEKFEIPILPSHPLPNIADPTTDPASFSLQQPTPPATDSSNSDSDGEWITPSNLDEHQAKDSGIESHSQTAKAIQLDVATMTIDFAMQNVLLQMNLHLLSTNMQRIKRLSTKVLRCHACFNIVKLMDKQFCPRCGQASLQRVSCSTNARGEFRIHLSRNYQWNTRGDKYSIPKPIHGTANGKWSGQGGGKGGWGRELILAEDQKEFQKQMDEDKRNKTRDLMDDDYLPGILTGYRGKGGGKPKVGAGRNVNAKKR